MTQSRARLHAVHVMTSCSLPAGGAAAVHGSAGPWKVNPRWVLDSEKFNEWMNPVDYETEEAIAEQERLGLLIDGPSGTCLRVAPQQRAHS